MRLIWLSRPFSKVHRRSPSASTLVNFFCVLRRRGSPRSGRRLEPVLQARRSDASSFRGWPRPGGPAQGAGAGLRFRRCCEEGEPCRVPFAAFVPVCSKGGEACLAATRARRRGGSSEVRGFVSGFRVLGSSVWGHALHLAGSDILKQKTAWSTCSSTASRLSPMLRSLTPEDLNLRRVFDDELQVSGCGWAWVGSV